jgi:hypothetical protein
MSAYESTKVGREVDGTYSDQCGDRLRESELLANEARWHK